jgi:predicted acylesterase/phospholipase RssA
MADLNKASDGPTPFTADAFKFENLPDWDNDFIKEEDILEFAKALAAPENSPSNEDLSIPQSSKNLFITALNDWRPIHQRVRKRKKRQPRRGKDETREGFVYTLLKWPLLLTVFGWLGFLGISYLFTRFYIYAYEHFITWRGKREKIRRKLQDSTTYQDWVKAAEELDAYLQNDKWKNAPEYAYYDSKTIRQVRNSLAKLRQQVEIEEMGLDAVHGDKEQKAIHELKNLVEACVKNNFVGFENPRLYSETYYGTKTLVQEFIDEAEAALGVLNRSPLLDQETKRAMYKHIYHNFGRTCLCLSGGATFAYYHFGVAKALLDANLLPEVITGTSGGALVAALLGTRTNEELRNLLVPALAHRITACHDNFTTWFGRWWKTGARFDSIDWAVRCAWFTRGSMTFREAYDRTGRILNVSCVPSDPHSPTILANYLTSPDCVIWSAVLASAAVPGILNPVVLMKKNRDGTLSPYSFGHKWKDGSLRTDIPLKSLYLHFNVRFSIVSQVNPHINLFFFSSRGSVGRPVTHRRGRGWRGGFLGSAAEQYLKLDLTKWLKVLRHLELLPRPLGQDWSEIWLQRFSGTITIWPKSIPSDFFHILSDPTPDRLARMIHVGQLGTFPKLKFIANRLKLERAIRSGRKATRANRGGMNQILSEDNLQGLLIEARKNNGKISSPWPLSGAESSSDQSEAEEARTNYKSSASSELKKVTPRRRENHTVDSGGFVAQPQYKNSETRSSPTLSNRLSGWWSSMAKPKADRGVSPYLSTSGEGPASMFELHGTGEESARQLYARAAEAQSSRRGSWVKEAARQTLVFADDSDTDDRRTGPKASKTRKRSNKGISMDTMGTNTTAETYRGDEPEEDENITAPSGRTEAGFIRDDDDGVEPSSFNRTYEISSTESDK